MHATSPVLLQSGFVVLVIALIAVDEATRLRPLRRFTSTAARLSVFRWTTASLCCLAALATALARPAQLLRVPPAADLAWLTAPPARAIAVTLLALYFVLALLPALQAGLAPRLRLRYWRQTRPLHFMLPVSDSERRWWILLSIAAGVGEEIVFRGFLMQYLTGALHGQWQLPLTLAWLLSSLVFGACHAYQGAAGIVRAAVGGLMFGLLALVCGNLLLPMLLHTLVDLAVLLVYHPGQDHPDAAARLVQGCEPGAAHAS